MALTWGDLRAADVGQPDEQEIMLSLGRGRIAGPLRLVEGLRVLPTDAVGYGIVHTDQGAPGTVVTLVVEAPRLEPGY